MRQRLGWAAAVIGLACGAGAHAAESVSAAPLRALVVTIVAQDGYLHWLLDDALRAARLPPVALTTSNVRDMREHLAHERYDIVIAHAHAGPPQGLERKGIIRDGRVVFANPVTIIGPLADPAGVAAAADFAGALARIVARGQCWVSNPDEGKQALQAGLGAGGTASPCIIESGATHGAAAVMAARERGAYTLWGFHPFARLALADMRAYVIGDRALLRPLRAWVVAASPRQDESRAAIELLLGEAVQSRIAHFRLRNDAGNQPWWPLSAVAQ